MARKAKKNTNPSPLYILFRILSFVGKPAYFLISRVFILLVFLITYSLYLVRSFTKLIPRFHLPIIRSRRLKFIKIKKRYILISIFITASTVFYYLIIKDLPSVKNLSERSPSVSTKIYDRNGVLLYKIYKDHNRTLTPLSLVPIQVRLATLAAEDAEFYSHSGFSIRGIFRALVQNFETGSVQGGSTITQQLVKNTLLSSEKTFIRKLKELVLSIQVESNYTKDQILEMYLNEVNYGGTAYGISEAASVYFGKRLEDLTLGESAMLAGLPKSPTLYSPFNKNPEIAFQRQKDILHLMKVNKFITKDQEQEALNSSVTFLSKKTEIEAPHFVMYIKRLLIDMYGPEMVENGGLEVVTSLDLEIQKQAEQIVKDEVLKLKRLNVGNGSALVINPQNGQILAMVGSIDYFDDKNDGNVNVLTRLRQPGSAIKVVNYAYALGNGYNPGSIIDDSPITYVTPGSPPYSPKNYDGKFIGKVNLRNALAQSRNIPAVKILASYGIPKMIDLGQKMGISTWNDPKDYGLSLTLGGGSVSGMDLALVYATIADYGKRPNIVPILQVKDYKQKILLQSRTTTTPVLDYRIAFQLIDILKDNNARAPEFGFNSALVIKDHPEVAVKTGTSNDLRDNWTVGFNQNFLVLTWVGNNDNSPMGRIASGLTGASPIWNKIMTLLLAQKESVEWIAPEGLVKIECRGKWEYFLRENVQPNFCKATPPPIPLPTPDREDKREKQREPQIR